MTESSNRRILFFSQKRDLLRIYSKLKIVVNPLQLGLGNQPDNIEEKRKEVRNWDLWGPFIFTLILSV